MEKSGERRRRRNNGQNEIMEFLRNQGRRLKEETMEGIKAGNTITRELLTSKIAKLKKELERKEKEWQTEKKIMQVRIEKLEDKVTALEAKTRKEGN